MNERERNQRNTNIKEIANEIRIIQIDLSNLIQNFKDNLIKYGNPDVLGSNLDLKEVRSFRKETIKLVKSTNQFYKWLQFWKKKDFYDKENEDETEIEEMKYG